MDIDLRGLTPGDIPAWNSLLAAAERVDRTGEHYNEADLAEEMANPELEPGKDLVGAFAGDELVGYYGVYARSAAEDFHRVSLEGTVRPDLRGRGIGTRVAEAMMTRAREVHRLRYPQLPVRYTLRALVQDAAAQEDLLAGVGLRPERWSFVMRADLSTVPQVPGRGDGSGDRSGDALGAGLEIRRYDRTLDRAMHEAHNAAFVDHPNSTPWSEAMWKQWVTDSRNFRPELSFVVLDAAAPERVAAYVQTSEYDAYFESTGRREAYVGKVGTRPEYRGRGIASTLLRHCLAEYQRAGYDEASLDVDSENPTGALGIYERAGFQVESRWTDYCLREPGAGGLR